MRNSVEITFWHLWRLPNIGIHISLNWHHIHRLNSIQLLIVQVLHSGHIILLFITSIALDWGFLTVLNWLIIRIPWDLSCHLQIKFLLICDWTNIIIRYGSATYQYLILLVLAMLHRSSNRIVTAPNVRLWFPWQFSCNILLILIELNSCLALTHNSF